MTSNPRNSWRNPRHCLTVLFLPVRSALRPQSDGRRRRGKWSTRRRRHDCGGSVAANNHRPDAKRRGGTCAAGHVRLPYNIKLFFNFHRNHIAMASAAAGELAHYVSGARLCARNNSPIFSLPAAYLLLSLYFFSSRPELEFLMPEGLDRRRLGNWPGPASACTKTNDGTTRTGGRIIKYILLLLLLYAQNIIYRDKSNVVAAVLCAHAWLLLL